MKMINTLLLFLSPVCVCCCCGGTGRLTTQKGSEFSQYDIEMQVAQDLTQDFTLVAAMQLHASVAHAASFATTQ